MTFQNGCLTDRVIRWLVKWLITNNNSIAQIHHISFRFFFFTTDLYTVYTQCNVAAIPTQDETKRRIRVLAMRRRHPWTPPTRQLYTNLAYRAHKFAILSSSYKWIYVTTPVGAIPYIYICQKTETDHFVNIFSFFLKIFFPTPCWSIKNHSMCCCLSWYVPVDEHFLG